MATERNDSDTEKIKNDKDADAVQVTTLRKVRELLSTRIKKNKSTVQSLDRSNETFSELHNHPPQQCELKVSEKPVAVTYKKSEKSLIDDEPTICRYPSRSANTLVSNIKSYSRTMKKVSLATNNSSNVRSDEHLRPLNKSSNRQSVYQARKTDKNKFIGKEHKQKEYVESNNYSQNVSNSSYESICQVGCHAKLPTDQVSFHNYKNSSVLTNNYSKPQTLVQKSEENVKLVSQCSNYTATGSVQSTSSLAIKNRTSATINNEHTLLPHEVKSANSKPKSLFSNSNELIFSTINKSNGLNQQVNENNNNNLSGNRQSTDRKIARYSTDNVSARRLNRSDNGSIKHGKSLFIRKASPFDVAPKTQSSYSNKSKSYNTTLMKESNEYSLKQNSFSNSFNTTEISYQGQSSHSRVIKQLDECRNSLNNRLMSINSRTVSRGSYDDSSRRLSFRSLVKTFEQNSEPISRSNELLKQAKAGNIALKKTSVPSNTRTNPALVTPLERAQTDYVLSRSINKDRSSHYNTKDDFKNSISDFDNRPNIYNVNGKIKEYVETDNAANSSPGISIDSFLQCSMQDVKDQFERQKHSFCKPISGVLNSDLVQNQFKTKLEYCNNPEKAVSTTVSNLINKKMTTSNASNDNVNLSPNEKTLNTAFVAERDLVNEQNNPNNHKLVESDSSNSKTLFDQTAPNTHRERNLYRSKFKGITPNPTALGNLPEQPLTFNLKESTEHIHRENSETPYSVVNKSDPYTANSLKKRRISSSKANLSYYYRNLDSQKNKLLNNGSVEDFNTDFNVISSKQSYGNYNTKQSEVFLKNSQVSKDTEFSFENQIIAESYINSLARLDSEDLSESEDSNVIKSVDSLSSNVNEAPALKQRKPSLDTDNTNHASLEVSPSSPTKNMQDVKNQSDVNHAALNNYNNSNNNSDSSELTANKTYANSTGMLSKVILKVCPQKQHSLNSKNASDSLQVKNSNTELPVKYNYFNDSNDSCNSSPYNSIINEVTSKQHIGDCLPKENLIIKRSSARNSLADNVSLIKRSDIVPTTQNGSCYLDIDKKPLLVHSNVFNKAKKDMKQAVDSSTTSNHDLSDDNGLAQITHDHHSLTKSNLDLLKLPNNHVLTKESCCTASNNVLTYSETCTYDVITKVPLIQSISHAIELTSNSRAELSAALDFLVDKDLTNQQLFTLVKLLSNKSVLVQASILNFLVARSERMTSSTCEILFTDSLIPAIDNGLLLTPKLLTSFKKLLRTLVRNSDNTIVFQQQVTELIRKLILEGSDSSKGSKALTLPLSSVKLVNSFVQLSNELLIIGGTSLFDFQQFLSDSHQLFSLTDRSLRLSMYELLNNAHSFGLPVLSLLDSYSSVPANVLKEISTRIAKNNERREAEIQLNKPIPAVVPERTPNSVNQMVTSTDDFNIQKLLNIDFASIVINYENLQKWSEKREFLASISVLYKYVLISADFAKKTLPFYDIIVTKTGNLISYFSSAILNEKHPVVQIELINTLNCLVTCFYLNEFTNKQEEFSAKTKSIYLLSYVQAIEFLFRTQVKPLNATLLTFVATIYLIYGYNFVELFLQKIHKCTPAACGKFCESLLFILVLTKRVGFVAENDQLLLYERFSSSKTANSILKFTVVHACASTESVRNVSGLVLDFFYNEFPTITNDIISLQNKKNQNTISASRSRILSKKLGISKQAEFQPMLDCFYQNSNCVIGKLLSFYNEYLSSQATLSPVEPDSDTKSPSSSPRFTNYDSCNNSALNTPDSVNANMSSVVRRSCDKDGPVLLENIIGVHRLPNTDEKPIHSDSCEASDDLKKKESPLKKHLVDSIAPSPDVQFIGGIKAPASATNDSNCNNDIADNGPNFNTPNQIKRVSLAQVSDISHIETIRRSTSLLASLVKEVFTVDAYLLNFSYASFSCLAEIVDSIDESFIAIISELDCIPRKFLEKKILVNTTLLSELDLLVRFDELIRESELTVVQLMNVIVSSHIGNNKASISSILTAKIIKTLLLNDELAISFNLQLIISLCNVEVSRLIIYTVIRVFTKSEYGSIKKISVVLLACSQIVLCYHDKLIADESNMLDLVCKFAKALSSFTGSIDYRSIVTAFSTLLIVILEAYPNITVNLLSSKIRNKTSHSSLLQFFREFECSYESKCRMNQTIFGFTSKSREPNDPNEIMKNSNTIMNSDCNYNIDDCQNRMYSFADSLPDYLNMEFNKTSNFDVTLLLKSKQVLYKLLSNYDEQASEPLERKFSSVDFCNEMKLQTDKFLLFVTSSDYKEQRRAFLRLKRFLIQNVIVPFNPTLFLSVASFVSLKNSSADTRLALECLSLLVLHSDITLELSFIQPVFYKLFTYVFRKVFSVVGLYYVPVMTCLYEICSRVTTNILYRCFNVNWFDSLGYSVFLKHIESNFIIKMHTSTSPLSYLLFIEFISASLDNSCLKSYLTSSLSAIGDSTDTLTYTDKCLKYNYLIPALYLFDVSTKHSVYQQLQKFTDQSSFIDQSLLNFLTKSKGFWLIQMYYGKNSTITSYVNQNMSTVLVTFRNSILHDLTDQLTTQQLFLTWSEDAYACDCGINFLAEASSLIFNKALEQLKTREMPSEETSCQLDKVVYSLLGQEIMALLAMQKSCSVKHLSSSVLSLLLYVTRDKTYSGLPISEPFIKSAQDCFISALCILMKEQLSNELNKILNYTSKARLCTLMSLFHPAYGCGWLILLVCVYNSHRNNQLLQLTDTILSVLQCYRKRKPNYGSSIISVGTDDKLSSSILNEFTPSQLREIGIDSSSFGLIPFRVASMLLFLVLILATLDSFHSEEYASFLQCVVINVFSLVSNRDMLLSCIIKYLNLTQHKSSCLASEVTTVVRSLDCLTKHKYVLLCELILQCLSELIDNCIISIESVELIKLIGLILKYHADSIKCGKILKICNEFNNKQLLYFVEVVGVTEFNKVLSETVNDGIAVKLKQRINLLNTQPDVFPDDCLRSENNNNGSPVNDGLSNEAFDTICSSKSFEEKTSPLSNIDNSGKFASNETTSLPLDGPITTECNVDVLSLNSLAESASSLVIDSGRSSTSKTECSAEIDQADLSLLNGEQSLTSDDLHLKTYKKSVVETSNVITQFDVLSHDSVPASIVNHQSSMQSSLSQLHDKIISTLHSKATSLLSDSFESIRSYRLNKHASDYMAGSSSVETLSLVEKSKLSRVYSLCRDLSCNDVVVIKTSLTELQLICRESLRQCNNSSKIQEDNLLNNNIDRESSLMLNSKNTSNTNTPHNGYAIILPYFQHLFSCLVKLLQKLQNHPNSFEELYNSILNLTKLVCEFYDNMLLVSPELLSMCFSSLVTITLTYAVRNLSLQSVTCLNQILCDNLLTLITLVKAPVVFESFYNSVMFIARSTIKYDVTLFSRLVKKFVKRLIRKLPLIDSTEALKNVLLQRTLAARLILNFIHSLNLLLFQLFADSLNLCSLQIELMNSAARLLTLLCFYNPYVFALYYRDLNLSLFIDEKATQSIDKFKSSLLNDVVSSPNLSDTDKDQLTMTLMTYHNLLDCVKRDYIQWLNNLMQVNNISFINNVNAQSYVSLDECYIISGAALTDISLSLHLNCFQRLSIDKGCCIINLHELSVAYELPDGLLSEFITLK